MSEFVSYGDEDGDGPVFDRACPSCGRYLRFPREMRWHEDITGRCTFISINCLHCGQVEPGHVGWQGDFR